VARCSPCRVRGGRSKPLPAGVRFWSAVAGTAVTGEAARWGERSFRSPEGEPDPAPTAVPQERQGGSVVRGVAAS
jgi:hypothetical protein